MHSVHRTIPIVCLILLAAPAVAQQRGSVLNLIEPEDRIRVGQETQGTLSASDYLSLRDGYLDVWGLEAQAGAQVTIDVASDDFDTYLFFTGPGLGETLSDDDGGAGCNARLTVRVLESGLFRIAVTSARFRETGVYTLRITEGDASGPTWPCGGVDPAALAALPTADRTLTVGQTVTGRLGPGDETLEDRPVQAWALAGHAGASVTLVLEADDFDAYLYVVGPGLESPLEDDDGAGGLNARLDVTFPETGTYKVVASARGSGGTGGFRLTAGESQVIGDLGTLDPERRRVTLGDTVTGTLGATGARYDDKPVQAWAFAGQAGQQVTITLESDEFDAYLYMTGPGLSSPLSDDDGAGGYNAQLTVTLPETGTYLIVASAFSGAGPYRLLVRGP